MGERHHILGVTRRLDPRQRATFVAGPRHRHDRSRRRPATRRTRPDEHRRSRVTTARTQRARPRRDGETQHVMLRVGIRHHLGRLPKRLVGHRQVDAEPVQAVTKPSEMAPHGERHAAHDRRRLETAVTHGEAMVRDRQTRLVAGNEFAVDPPGTHPRKRVTPPRRDVTMLAADDVCKSLHRRSGTKEMSCESW